ncbi:hypothetical protein FE374_18660 [Georgenia yuyongxinii]|uniref:Gram-positive cocci surface proteins LPxTG domain-containing protein n=1 Tax=Georgenia yuyongxinii TaxID=2589797 RepID=A0A5B8CAS9_9MICO|nr:hypothetical protein [Georgenia yuyongxinii]QDC26362.1 hypothetical protein FE374_18660 [Georgenia yuyongxinii]
MTSTTTRAHRGILAALAATGLLAPALGAAPALAAAPAPALAAAAAPVTASAPPGATSAGACAAGEGVSVVVDLTDLGGELEVGCATGDPATGREALEAAGFPATDSQPGMICAIAGLPDPCPTEFDGRYWAYWSAEPAGEWTARTEGADTADPAPGTFEGWRYNDGATAPGATPAEVVAAAGATAQDGAEPPAPSEVTAADDATPAEATTAAGTSDDAGTNRGTVAALAGAVVLLVVAGVVARRRRA